MKTTVEPEAVSIYIKGILAVYGLIFLASLYLLPTAVIGLPLVLFALLTVRACSAFTVKLARASNHLYLTDSFLLLALMVFDAEAAALLALRRHTLHSASFQ